MQLNALVISYAASAVISVGVAIDAWRRRPAPGASALALLMAAVAWWLVANAAEAAVTALPAKIAWSVWAYPGVVSVPVLFLIFALKWTHQDPGLSRGQVALLFVVPALSVAMAATNGLHHLLWPYVTLVDAWGVTAVYGHGSWFWIELAYAYGVSAAGLLAIVVALRRHPAFYSSRARVAIIATCVPLVGSAIYAAGLDAPLHADLSSIAFALTGLLAVWGTLHSRALDPVPIAWSALVEMLTDGVLVLGPERRLAAANPAASRLLGIDPKAVGRPIEELLLGLPALAAVAAAARDTEAEVWVDDPAVPTARPFRDAERRSGGRWLDARLSVIADAHDREVGRLLVVHDVTEHRNLVETARQLSFTDVLTGLLNRRGFMTFAERQVRSSMRSRGRFWLLFGDVDGLKDINDRLGHEAGDEALREVAVLLRLTVRDSDIVARYGGDEFAILIAETGETVDEDRLVERIEASLRRRQQMADRPFALSLSLGAVAFDPAHPVSLDDLIREADRRMYLRKRNSQDGNENGDVPLGVAS